MRLKHRQYILIAIFAGLAIAKAVERYHLRQATLKASTPAAKPFTRGASPIWSAYEAAAAQRDAPADQFQPALATLNLALAPLDAGAQPGTTPEEGAALRSCKLWLLFYRQEALHPDNRANWRAQTLAHTTSCAADHADTAP